MKLRSSGEKTNPFVLELFPYYFASVLWIKINFYLISSCDSTRPYRKWRKINVDLLIIFFLLLVLESGLKRFCSRNILIILGFSSIMAVIALIAVGLTQNKPLPENVKVTQILRGSGWGLAGEGGYGKSEHS